MRKSLLQDTRPTPLDRPHRMPRFSESWLQELDDDAATGDIAPDLLRDVILPSQLLASVECLDVYHGMFALRVEEALERRYPAVNAVVGETRFSELCRDHALEMAGLDALPAEIEARFPAHLAQSERLDDAQRPWIAELARLERAIDLADEADEPAVLQLAELIALGREAWSHARLVPVPSLQLLHFEHQIDGAYDSWRHGDAPAAPLRHAQWLVVFRDAGEHAGRIQRLSIPRRAFALLSALCAGKSLREAIDESLGAHARPESQHRLFQWLCSWVASGMFRSIETRCARGETRCARGETHGSRETNCAERAG